MVAVVVDTSAFQALLVEEDAQYPRARRFWDISRDDELVTHGYVVVEAMALVRRRLGWAGVDALVNGLLPAVRIEMVDRALHEDAMTMYTTVRGGTSFIDQVTILFARRLGIQYAFGSDNDLVDAGLRFPPLSRPSNA